ncbi:MAG: DMT family transporter [Gaiellaceae bacterium]
MRRISTVDLMLLATVLLWSLNFTVTKYALTHGFQPLAYSAIRYGAAAVIFTVFTARREGLKPTIGRHDWMLLLIAAGVGIWLNQIGYVYSIKLTTASTVALILGVTPIFAALGAWALGAERLPGRFWFAAAVSFLGVALVAGGSGTTFTGSVTGDLLAVMTAATWAAYSLIVAPLMRRHSPYRISSIVLAAGWIPLAITASHQLANQSWDLSWQVYACLVYATIGPLVITNVLWYTAVSRVGASRATLFANIQPFFAALIAVVLLSEPLSWSQVAGGAAIAIALVLSRLPQKVPQEPLAD